MLTKLSIINSMLASIGVAQFAAETPQHPSYLKASNKLDEVSVEFQSIGWWFNKSTRLMRPNGVGEIILPANTMHADPADTGDNLVMRGGRLYDITNNTFELHREVNVVFVEALALTDLPATAAAMLKAEVVYAFYVDSNGGEPKLTQYINQWQRARGRFQAEHLRNADVNAFRSTSFMEFRRPGSGSRRLPHGKD